MALSDIVLVTVDSLRADHCSFMGYDRETTPALDDLASAGTTYVNAVAPGPSTPESMPMVFTGRRLYGDGDPTDIAAARTDIRRHLSAYQTIPQMLTRRGYATAGFTPNPFTSRFFGFDAGFDHFQDFMGSSVRKKYGRTFDRFIGGTSVGPVARLAANLVLRQEAFKPWGDYYDDVLEWVRTVDSPYFLWVHLMDPHIPYLPPRNYRTQPWWVLYYANYRFWREDKDSEFDPRHRARLIRAYDDAIRYADAFVDRVRTDLEREPVFVVHGDHGEAFGEHGTYGHEPRLYDENIHVPLLVGGRPDGEIHEPLSLVRIPEIVDAIAAGRPLPRPDPPFAVSRTRRGDRAALRGKRAKYLANGSGEEVFDLYHGEESSIENDRLLAVCRDWHRFLDCSAKEARAIRSGAQAVE